MRQPKIIDRSRFGAKCSRCGLTAADWHPPDANGIRWTCRLRETKPGKWTCTECTKKANLSRT
jgi:hypothetical protein